MKNLEPLRPVRRLFWAALPAIFTLLLAACGDDDSSSSGTSLYDVATSVATASDLYACDSTSEGDVQYVTDEEAYYFCSEGEWIDISSLLDGTYERSSSSAESSSSEADTTASDTTATDSTSSLTVLELLDSLFACTDSLEGHELYFDDIAAYVFDDIDSNDIYICTGGEWVLYDSTTMTLAKDLADSITYPTTTSPDFTWEPNDMAQNDSIAANLATGVYILISPGASYTMSFDADTSAGAPELQLFGVYTSGSSVAYLKKAEATLVDDRYVFEFESGTYDYDYWVTSLRGEDGERYSGKVANVKLEGTGAYSSTLSLNFVQLGAYVPPSDSITFDSLAHAIFEAFKETYSTITVDTYYVSNAAEHPTYGDDYPDTVETTIAYSDKFPELTDWETDEVSAALDFIIGYYITKSGVLGFSPRPGTSTKNSGRHVTMGTHHYSSVYGIVAQSSAEMIHTAIHEGGHFMGLRHTTSSVSDLVNDGDYSNVEDGIEDTEYCNSVVSASVASGSVPTTDVVPSFYYAAASTTCGDYYNYLYPYENDENVDGEITEGQLDVVARTLPLIIH